MTRMSEIVRQAVKFRRKALVLNRLEAMRLRYLDHFAAGKLAKHEKVRSKLLLAAVRLS